MPRWSITTALVRPVVVAAPGQQPDGPHGGPWRGRTGRGRRRRRQCNALAAGRVRCPVTSRPQLSARQPRQAAAAAFAGSPGWTLPARGTDVPSSPHYPGASQPFARPGAAPSSPSSCPCRVVVRDRTEPAAAQEPRHAGHARHARLPWRRSARSGQRQRPGGDAEGRGRRRRGVGRAAGQAHQCLGRRRRRSSAGS